MQRRGFLKRFLAGAVGTVVAETLDWDKLLWEPGKKSWFIPAKRMTDGINSIRFVQSFNDRGFVRFDVLYGWAHVHHPEMSCRILA